MTYQTTSDKWEQEASSNGAQELSDPVEKAGEDGDLPTNSQSEGDSWIHVAPGDVGSDCNRHEQSEPVAHGHRHQPCRI